MGSRARNVVSSPLAPSLKRAVSLFWKVPNAAVLPHGSVRF